jgi:8-oxo-dGTP pyrophosphatase MutT (NUDIX family)
MRESQCINGARGSPRLTIDPLLEVSVPTATAIVRSAEDAFRVLVGHSRKHNRPVLPGGKIERADIVSFSMLENAACCMSRELREEIGISDLTLSLYDVISDADADRRIVTVRSLRATLVEDAIRSLDDSQMVLARYGVPDFVFVASVQPELIKASDELLSLEWIDCRRLAPEMLAAAHGKIVKRYCDNLIERR